MEFFIIIWISAVVINCFTVLYSIKILKVKMPYRNMIVILIINLLPVNIILLIDTFPTLKNMIFNRRTYIQDNVEKVEAFEKKYRNQYAEDFINKQRLQNEFNDYVNSKLLMNKLIK